MGNHTAVYGDAITLEAITIHFPFLSDKDPGYGKRPVECYSLMCLVDKDDKDNLTTIREAIKETGAVNKLSELQKHPLVDDDGAARDGDEKEYAGFKDRMYFKVKSNDQPDLYFIDEDGDVQKIDGGDKEAIKREFYAGAICHVMLQPATYDEGCVTFYLKGVCKVEDGEKLASKVDTRAGFLAILGNKGAKKANSKLAETKAKRASRDTETEDETDEEDEEPAPKAKSGKKTESTRRKPVEEEEEEMPPKKRGRPAKAADPEEEEDEEPAPKKKAKKPVEDDEDEEPAPKKAAPKSKAGRATIDSLLE